MKFIQIIILLISFVQVGYSQPSNKTIEGNLNDISEKDILNCLTHNGSDYSVNLIGLGQIIIDSTTDLKRLNLLSDFELLNLSIKLDTLPKAFEQVSFKAKTLSVEGNHILQDISSINLFKELENLGVSNFIGTQLSKNKLKIKSLVTLGLYNCPQIENLDVLSNLNSLAELGINELSKIENLNVLSNLESLHTLSIEKTPKLKEFPKLDRKNQLVNLSLKKLSSDLLNLEYLTKVKTLNLEVTVWEFPDFLPPNIESLKIRGQPFSSLEDISNINMYQKLVDLSLSKLKIKDSTSTFSSKNLNRLYLGYSTDIGYLNFIFSFRKINSLVLENLNKIEKLDSKNCITEFSNVKLNCII